MSFLSYAALSNPNRQCEVHLPTIISCHLIQNLYHLMLLPPHQHLHSLMCELVQSFQYSSLNLIKFVLDFLYLDRQLSCSDDSTFQPIHSYSSYHGLQLSEDQLVQLCLKTALTKLSNSFTHSMDQGHF
jgi:hypothetical protein